MRFQPELSTYSHCPHGETRRSSAASQAVLLHKQRKKKEQILKDCKKPEERNDYYETFNLLNPEGTIHVLLKGDILTSYEQRLQNVFQKNFKKGEFR